MLVVFLSACRQESYWERTLLGPFQGEPFTGRLTEQPVSSLPVSSHLVLGVHWEDALEHPILGMREVTGESVWAQVLIPQFEDEEEPRGRITTLTLKKSNR